MIINPVTKNPALPDDIFYLAYYVNQSYWLCIFKYEGTATVFDINTNMENIIYDQLNYIAVLDTY